MTTVLFSFIKRLQLPELTARPTSVPWLAIFSFVNGCLSIGLMAMAARITNHSLLFPSLGPTAFLFFFSPLAATASPRNALYGHAIGAASGYLSLVIFGLTEQGPALESGVTDERVFASALSLGLTSGLMVLLRAPHPPAGATTLIISLGILREVQDLIVLMVAVALLTGQAFVINRLAGIPYPRWAPAEEQPK